MSVDDGATITVRSLLLTKTLGQWLENNTTNRASLDQTRAISLGWRPVKTMGQQQRDIAAPRTLRTGEY